MSSTALKSWLAEPSAGLIWIEFEAYARRVFANAGDDWYRDAPRYAGTVIQAQGVIPTRCLSVDITAPCIATLGDGRHSAAALVESFESPQGLSFIDDVLSALVHRFVDQLDLVLKLAAPADLIAGDVDFDALDDVAGAMTGLIRSQSDKAIAAVVLDCAERTALSDDEVDAYEPLMGAARHYDWCTALAFSNAISADVDSNGLDVDVVLLPATPALELPGGAGGGLSADFWAGAADPSTFAADTLLYGGIPADAEPEDVLSVLGTLPG